MRWIFRAVSAVIILVLVALVGLLLLPGERIAAEVTKRFEAATGRKMEIAGDVSPTLWPTIGVKVEKVAIANAGWSDDQPLLSAETVKVGVDAMALIGGDIRVTEVRLTSPRIRLEKAPNGQVNWDLSGAPAGDAASGSTGGSALPRFSLDQGVIRDAQVTYVDRAFGQTQVLSNADIDIALPAFDGPLSLAITGRMNGEPLETDLTFESFADLLAGKGRSIDGRIAIGPSRAAFGGIVEPSSLGADMTIDATLADIAQLFRAIGQPAPELPDALSKKITLKGKVILADGNKIFLRDGALVLAGNSLSGDADVVLGDRMKIVGRFAGGDLDFTRLTGGGAGQDPEAQNTVGTGWSTDTIDVSGLAAADADIRLSAKSIDLGTLKLDRTALNLTLTDRRLVFGINELLAYRGSATGQFVINGRGGLSVGGDLRLRGMQIEPLLTDFAGYERLNGTTDFDLKFLGVGNSVDAIMKSLSGNGAIKVGDGALKGLDIVGMIRNLDLGYVGEGQKTIFDTIGATFSIDKGILSNDDLAFRAPLMTASGRGILNLGQQTVDYRILPVALPDGQGKGLKVPLKVTGPWADPKFGLDMQAIIDQELADEKAAVKARIEEEKAAAKARIEAEKAALEARAKAKVQEKLGLSDGTEDGTGQVQSGQDVLKEKLEDEAKKGLLKLLGRN